MIAPTVFCSCASIRSRCRDETEISAKVIGRDIPLRVGKTSLAAYANDSFGSIEMHGIDAKVCVHVDILLACDQRVCTL
jgi:hypothetical protein